MRMHSPEPHDGKGYMHTIRPLARVAVGLCTAGLSVVSVLAIQDDPGRPGRLLPAAHHDVPAELQGLGPAPVDPMLVEPLLPVEAVVLARGEAGELIANVKDDGELCLMLRRDGRGGGLCAYPTLVEPLILGEVGSAPDDPNLHLVGVVRGRATEVRVTPEDGRSSSVPAVHHPGIPGLSFFVAPASGPLTSVEAIGNGEPIAASDRALLFTRS